MFKVVFHPNDHFELTMKNESEGLFWSFIY